MADITSQSIAASLPAFPCDICGQDIEKGERHVISDGGLTVEHTACVSGWFRTNFGREGLS